MISLFGARQAEEFATAVDDGLRARGPRRAETVELVGVVTVLRDRGGVEPRAEFAQDLRARLMAEAETALTAGAATLTLPARSRGTHERRLVAAASAFVLIGGSATMAAAAQSALPGEALYPIKRGIERAEAGLSLSPAGKGRDLLQQAGDRLTEVRSLVTTDAPQSRTEVPETLTAFTSQATAGADLLFSDYGESRDPESIATVRSFTVEGIKELEQLADLVPAEAQDELAAAALALHDIDGQASRLCHACAADIPAVELPGIFLAHAEADRALRMLSSVEVDNDHPVEVPKSLLAERSEDVAPGETDGLEPKQDTEDDGSASDDDAYPVPTPDDWAPDDLVTPLLPGVENKSSGSVTDGSKSGGSLTGDLTDAVETLLPDTDTGLLP